MDIYRSFVENFHGIAFRRLLNDKIVLFEGMVKEISGYDKEEFMNKKITWKKLMHPDDLERLSENIHRLHVIRNYSTEREYRIKTKNGKMKWIHENLRRIDEKNQIYIEGTIVDISKMKNAELQLRESEVKRSEEQMQKEKLESIALLAGGIAHDFNNILTSVLGNLELMQMESLEGETQLLLTETLQATHRATNLTQQLLTFSKGKKPIKKTESIIQILDEASSFVLRGSNCKTQCIFEDLIPPINVDANQILQVINNLLINAKQAMEKGGIITISCSTIDINRIDTIPLPFGKYLKIAIKDTGKGIPKEIQSKIFQPYFTTKSRGSGLGLATSYSVIKNHNGHINFQSTKGVGTVFNIFLPVWDEAFVIEEKRNENSILPENMKVLVMDDDKAIHRMLSRIFKRYKYRMDSTYAGEEAIELYNQALLENTPYDLVIMDLTIPAGLGGEATAGEILRINPDAKMIVSSGYSNNEILANYKKYGFQAILKKPYTVEDLRKVINIIS
ncbi:Sensor histidine kinase RcsC [Candidatus Lokiarchaeum ossiferum]|uniref:Sensor histidine kinase RcsC n=1 Tax=Candidatus Lokiarchaeum ossiferum TaxID=2951803 RepID=A0ABY6HLT9_9ARCH|nr:Sensor histidine kinase RcsC [Candidatus Lokiarchaeum sp. B-35]